MSYDRLEMVKASFEKKADMVNAALLLATVICKNILTDGPLHEEA